MKKLVFVMLCLAAVLMFGSSASASEFRAPAFELPSLDGKKFTQKDLDGKVTLMVFWASSCGTCKKELPKVRDLQKKMESKGLQVLTVGFLDTEADIRNYVASNPRIFTFPVLYGAEGRVAIRWGVRATPTIFLIDTQGEIVLSHLGGGLLENPTFHKRLDAELLKNSSM